MSMTFYKNTRTTERVNVDDYGYTTLDQQETQNLIKSLARLMDSVFETPHRDFENYVRLNAEECDLEPHDVLTNMFGSIEDADLTKYQSNFRDFARANSLNIFKWYKKNGCQVKLSPKQVDWFNRWFTKHGIGHETLIAKNPNYTRSVVPNFGE